MKFVVRRPRFRILVARAIRCVRRGCKEGGCSGHRDTTGGKEASWTDVLQAMDVEVENDAFVEQWLGQQPGETLHAALCRAMEWDGEKDAVARVRREMSDGEAQGRRLLWLALLLHLRHRCGLMATSWEQLRCQLTEALGLFVSLKTRDDGRVWPVLREVCDALVGCSPANPHEAAVMLRVAGVPAVLDFDALPQLESPSAFAQLALCLEALRDPHVVVVKKGEHGSEHAARGGSRIRSDTGKRELKEAQSVEQLRDLVLTKQRQVEVVNARLAKLDKVAKEEKMWLSSKMMELEEQLRQARASALLESELEEKRREVLHLRRQLSVDAEGMSALKAKMASFNAERAEMESALLQKLNEAQAAPAPDKPARQIGGARWTYLPWFMLLFCGLGITGLYVWAYYNGHLFLEDRIPFISSAIDLPPESCLGSLFLTLVAAQMLMLVSIRWRLNTSALDEHNLQMLASSRAHHRLNGFAFVCGCIACLCVVGIGSFQEHNIRLAHLLFGAFFFAFMLMSMLCNTVIDWKVRAQTGIRVFRLVLVLLGGAVFVSVVAMYWSDTEPRVADAKAVLEIVCSAIVIVYMMTYSHDFAKVEVLFDVRKLSQQDWERRRLQAEAEDLPLLAHLDGDVF